MLWSLAFCHFPCGSVDWNLYRREKVDKWGKSLPLRKCGLKSQSMVLHCTCKSHFPCGSVDWNTTATMKKYLTQVTSLAEVWIEIFVCFLFLIWITVTSLAEVWIEIVAELDEPLGVMSLPLRKCGLKFQAVAIACAYISHFPCGSVDWNFSTGLDGADGVSHFPCGSVDWNAAWNPLFCLWISSLPLRKCGLKWLQPWYGLLELPVTSLAEVWIEIFR